MLCSEICDGAGVIIYTVKNSKLCFLMVQNKQKNFSFPKGKPNKDETVHECALREMSEETGLTENDLKFQTVDDEVVQFIEVSKKKKRVYYLAELIKSEYELDYDSTELEWVGLITFDKLMKIGDKQLKPRRKDIAKEVAKLVLKIENV